MDADDRRNDAEELGVAARADEAQPRRDAEPRGPDRIANLRQVNLAYQGL